MLMMVEEPMDEDSICLHQLMDERGHTYEQSIKLALLILSTLAELEELGIFHGQITPEHIFLKMQGPRFIKAQLVGFQHASLYVGGRFINRYTMARSQGFTEEVLLGRIPE